MKYFRDDEYIALYGTVSQFVSFFKTYFLFYLKKTETFYCIFKKKKNLNFTKPKQDI